MQPVLQNGSYVSNVSFTNSTAGAGTNLRITSLSFNLTGITLTTPLPVVYGNLPANGSAGSKPITYTIPTSVPAGTPFVMSMTVEVTDANGSVLVSNRAIGRNKP